MKKINDFLKLEEIKQTLTSEECGFLCTIYDLDSRLFEEELLVKVNVPLIFDSLKLIAKRGSSLDLFNGGLTGYFSFLAEAQDAGVKYLKGFASITWDSFQGVSNMMGIQVDIDIYEQYKTFKETYKSQVKKEEETNEKVDFLSDLWPDSRNNRKKK